MKKIHILLHCVIFMCVISAEPLYAQTDVTEFVREVQRVSQMSYDAFDRAAFK